MPAITHHDVVIPRELDAQGRTALADDLYAVHGRIFDGVDKASFVKYVIDSRAEHTRVFLHRNAEGALVGYFALHIFEVTRAGETTAVVRAEAGTVGAYRGGNVNARLGLKMVFEYIAAHPGRPVVYLGSLVHPSSYSLFASYSDRVWPNAEAAPPAEIAALMAELAEKFGLEPVSEDNRLICKVGWRTRDSAADRAFWMSTDKPGARFFCEINPGYGEGHGLLTVIPVSPAGVIRFAGRYAAAKARRRVVSLGESVVQGLRGLVPSALARAA